MFIAFEGPDGSGTTRQSQFLAQRMRAQGHTVLLTHEPTDTAIGRSVRNILRNEPLPSAEAVQLLFCADRAEHVTSVIAPALKRGEVVISDRYVLSTIVYGTALGIDAEWLRAVNRHFPVPDMVFVTLPPFSVCEERLKRRTEQDQFETDTFQRRVYDGYKSIEDTGVIFVDTSGGKEETADWIERHVHELLKITDRASA